MTEVIAELVGSGRIADIAIAVVGIEIVLLVLLAGRRAGARAATLGLVAHLLSGGALLMALRASLTGAGWQAIAGWLAVALVAHAIDLVALLRARR